ncbi:MULTISPECIES: uracil-DNA glycosylase family protein [unclassified Herbaspirillum]|uniref:uracil-DNA glycosylase family protein n=1 Tax=unclassified Herbaspirillum TaxID=2624150 RepID=UPI001150E59E|nr:MULTISPECIES: uracil-DNA glycosylase family protein [unclassified Herbaspirillum]MBB5392501.1 uracil-DNA glycosylase [Herbaspirillum sp. SJZ102]TQK06141.1 uracil-DNA glycosylase [Herbaspirillum sp. SJZ130]TQK12381.1 uracil-DNA glycosylase [Herbaspirillum sp. SJZ106]
MASRTFNSLLADIRQCTTCAAFLPLGPRPVIQAHPQARVLIAGQAPGKKVHMSGVPFDDASGDRLRLWLGIDRATFYDPHAVAILPMGFCYPGTGKSGDLPPRPECAPKWRAALLAQLPNIALTLVIGQYALAYHYPSAYPSLTEAVLDWRNRSPDVIVLPHPSPRNQLWVRRNPWFETELLPDLRSRIALLLGGAGNA